jgi:RHS repeat-associated protein
VQTDLQGNGSQFSVQLINSQEGTDGSAFVEFSNDPTMTISYVPSVPAGTGPVPNGSFVHFPISDRVSLEVNVGSGNALLTTSDITLPEIAGPLAVGAAYNSLDAGWGPLSMGANGWSQQQGVDVLLDKESNGNLLFLGPDGLSGTFATISGKTTYTSPGNFHVTLEQSPSGTCGSTGWTMYWHDTGGKMCFNTSGYLTSESDRDNLGSVTGIVENCGCTEATYAYDPYGNITAKSGAADADNLLLYTGALTDTGASNTTGYVHDGSRWYEAATGAFTGLDTNSYLANPADGNRYAYAADNPANYIDPTGQDVWGDVLGGVLAIGGAALAVAGVVVSIPVLTVVGAIAAIAGAGIWVYQTECKYGGEGSMWTMPGQCTVFG